MSISLSPLSVVSFSSFGVVVERLGWEASSRSILLWVADSSVPLKCRVGSASSDQVAGLVAMLRLSRQRGWKINLGVRKGWDNGKWFCAAKWTSELAVVDTFDGVEWGQHTIDEDGRVIEDWEYYGHSSPDTYVEGEGCGVVGCCV